MTGGVGENIFDWILKTKRKDLQMISSYRRPTLLTFLRNSLSLFFKDLFIYFRERERGEGQRKKESLKQTPD